MIDIGLGHLPIKRPWRKKDPKIVALNRINCIKRWRELHPEKIREYARKAYYKIVSTKEGRKKVNMWSYKRYKEKISKNKECQCGKKILSYSLLCNSCALIKRWDDKNGVIGRRLFYHKKCINCDNIIVYKSMRCHSCASKQNWMKGVFNKSIMEKVIK